MAVYKWTAQDVAQKVIQRQPLFILDVRNKADFEDWKIDGHHFEYLNVPYFELLDGVDGIIEQIPEDQDILVV